MGKVKGNKQKLVASTTTTTPLKTINGKVHKVRVKVKNLKLQINPNENESLTKPVDTEDIAKDLNKSVSTIRKCFVKLRRVKETQGPQINNNTLQVQCKVNDEKITIEDKLLNSPAKSRNNVRQNIVEIKESGTEKCTTDLIDNVNKVGDTNKSAVNNIRPIRSTVRNKTKTLPDNNKNNDIRMCKITESSIRTCTTKCLVRIKRIPKTAEYEHSKTTTEAIDLNPSESQTVVPVIDKIKRNNFRKLSLNMSKNGKVKTISEITSEKQLHTTNANTKNETESQSSNCLERTNIVHNSDLTKTRNLLLRGKKPVENNNLEMTQFEPQQNSTICFAPVQNSTLIEFNCTNDKNKQKIITVENKNDKEKETEIEKSNSNDNSSFHNFANKSQEIEDLLDSIDDDDAMDAGTENNAANKKNNVQDNITKISPVSNKTNIFFHRQDKTDSLDDDDFHNFANKSQEIEDLLDSIDDDDAMDAGTENNATNKKDNVQDNITKISPVSNKTNRFFHRQDKNVLKEVEVNVPKNCPPKKKSTILKSHRKTKRSSLAKRDNIYDFLSQSQTSDSDSNKHLDPAADIIKKLIAQGKVRVATKGSKGRPVLKRNARKKQVAKKVKPTAIKKAKKDNQKIIEVDDHMDFDDHFMDNHDDDEPSPEVNNNMEQQHQDPRVKRFSNNNNQQHHISDQEGTFSRLARSVLINQAGRSDLQRQKAQRLLEMAKKFVSTPKNKKISLPHEALHSNLSPIAMPSPRPAGSASPWRVDEDAHLPRVFNFNRSSGNLPSFSSDFIPLTPRKEKPKKKSIHQSPLPEINHQSSIPSLTPLPANDNSIAADPTPPATNEQSILSSFSSNDSNAENMPPPKPTHHVDRNDNDDIFNLKQYPNPKRTLNYRSPLKAINILEVVHLSPYKHPSKTLHANDLEKDKEMFGFEEDLNDDSLEIERSINGVVTPQDNHCKKSKLIPTEDLFGFEDYLTQTERSSQELRDDAETINHNNKSIYDKLQDLRKLRPDENELNFNVLKEKTRNPLKTIALFEDGAAGDAVVVDGMRQRGIKEMLCSTMIQSPQASTSKAALEQLKKRNVRDTQKPNFVEDSNISELFKDPEPEVTFNENDAHRTYIRPYKRKRRLKENRFVMFLESDESGDEDNSAEHNKHHTSHETDTSSEKAPKKKRKRKEAKEKPEMTEFIHDFNEMCNEVNSYELIVEKSV